ncbi:thioesterase superfamily protein, partial [Haematococcus lacustris]
MAATRVVMHQIVLPSEVDGSGICFGGQVSEQLKRQSIAAAPHGTAARGPEVLSWIDICAGMSAKTLARGPCVTAVVGAVHFLRPCRLGAVVIVAAMVHRTFTSSMEVGVRVEAEDMRTGQRHHCCSAY